MTRQNQTAEQVAAREPEGAYSGIKAKAQGRGDRKYFVRITSADRDKLVKELKKPSSGCLLHLVHTSVQH
ncbi:hypothetical protein WJX74_009327 [Apatococcus lobatus]|uniref:Uncharacterized protein n=1 Tax=Apatococcus lobatus TaxID=904363 RepID=A0AAW1RU16_9CHLO